MTGRSKIASLLLTCAVTPAAAAQMSATAAQDEAPQAGVQAETGDIIVTARRREESSQKVPVSVVALGARQLEERQVRSLYDLTSVAPGIRFVAQGGSGNVNVVMRGLAKAPAGDSPNSVISYFGDIPLYFQGSDIPTFDLQNVQVLKGPQGTLFGRNSIGGAVIISPQRPTYDLEGFARAAIGNYDLRDLEGAINYPIVADRLAVRLASKLSRRDGFVKIVNQDNDGFDDFDRDAVRASILFEPTEAITNITVADYLSADETGGNALLFDALPGGVTRTPALAPFFNCGVAPNCDIDLALERQRAIGPYRTFTWRNPYLDREIWGVQNRTEIDFGPFQLRNIIGYRQTSVETHNEAQANDFGSPLATGPGRPLLASDIFVKIKQFSEEIQLLGTLFDDRLDWIVGYFHIKESPYADNAVRTNIATTTANVSHAFNYRTSNAVFGQIGFS